MRKMFVTSFVLFVLINLIAYYILPDHMATHFGTGGKPDGWSSDEANLAMMTGI